jgi:hypothetical protein
MEQAHPSSRKRANLLNSPPNESPCHCSCHGDPPHEYGPRRKRQRPEQSLRVPITPSNAFAVSNDDSFRIQQNRDYLPTHTQTNSNDNVVEDEFSFSPAGHPLGSQPCLRVVNQMFPQHIVEATTNRTAETSPTCTVTNDTFSPRSMSQQVLSDTNYGTTRSQDGANEELFDGSEGLDFGFGDELQWDTSNNSLLMFGDPGRSSFQCVICP